MKKAMKQTKKCTALFLAAGLVVTAVPANGLVVNAAPQAANVDVTNASTDLSYEGYELKWSDEFNGTELDRSAWNVETHEKGWVNSEWQAYVDSDEVLNVGDGVLNINAVKKTTEIEDNGNLFRNGDFSSGKDEWVETIQNWEDPKAEATSTVITNGIKYEIGAVGTADWHIQLKQDNVNLLAGHTYKVSYKVNTTAARTIKSGVQSAAYAWYGGSDPELNANEDTEVSFEFTMDADDSTAAFYISMGQIAGVDTPASTITITDLMMKDVTEGADTSEQISADEASLVTYESGRISTQNLEAFTYGMFECRAKVPEGAGYLPAFWLMANDESVYGQWPRCGEIDCMEVMGQDTDKLYGTIHYGNPHAESQGTYTNTVEGNSFSDDFHTFNCEWEPGSIKWYVDGVLYHEEHNWYSTTEGQGTLTYPAPFDQPFYIILNLAVGGSWVGNPDENTSFDNNPYQIDYVRVYQKDSYNEDVEKPEIQVELRDPDETGNYINNGGFTTKESLSDGVDWEFMTALGGEATATVNTTQNILAIKTTDPGTVDYSVQLVQANVPLLKGATYRVSFDAKASAPRDMHVDVKAPDHGYMNYMNGSGETVSLGTAFESYSYEFKMKSDSDANGRLEYNMGNYGSDATIYLKNVRIEKIADPDPNEKEEKVVLANGSYIYNGSFQEGKGHLGYWDIAKKGKANVFVTDFSDGRRCKVELGDSTSVVKISQGDLTFAEGTPYLFSFDLQSEQDTTVSAAIAGHLYTFDVKAGENKTYNFELDSTEELTARTVAFKFTSKGTYYLDNVKFVENAMIKNGSFKDGTSGYSIYVDSSASASYGVDSLKEDYALGVTVNNTGDQDWKIQVKQENVKLEAGKSYKLKLDAKSDLEREIRVIMQGGENRGYSVYSSDNIVKLTDEYQTITDIFTMEEDTDPAAFLSVCLGMINDNIITTQHTVYIDNISLEEHTHEFKSVITKKATLTEDGEVSSICTDPDCGYVRKTASFPKIDTVTIAQKSYPYDGTAKKPAITVKDSTGKELKNGTDYSVAYTDNKAPGTATATVTFKGKYEGEKKFNFKITLGTTTIKNVANAEAGVNVTWYKTAGATGYTVYRKTPTSGWVILGSVAGNVTTYNDATAKSGKTYIYAVKATCGDTKGGYVESKEILCLKQPIVKVANTKSGVKVAWGRVADVTGYVIYRKEANGSFTKIKVVSDPLANYYVDTKAENGKEYGYAVVAFVKNEDGTMSTSSYVKDVTIKCAR